MLGIGGKFAGAKGMVAVPNLSNLSPDAALSALQSVGLSRGTVGTGTTSNSGLNNKVFSQSVSAGTLIDYDSAINYEYYIFVAPPVPEQPPAPTPVLCGSSYWVEASRSFDCSLGGGFSRTRIVEELRQNYCLSGVPTGQYIVLDTNSYFFSDASQRDGVCGYTAPSACVPQSIFVSDWLGACINNYQIYAVRYRDSCTGVETVISSSIYCCEATLTVVSTWQGSCISCYRQTATRYRNSCTGAEFVENGSVYCCAPGGGGGGGGAQVAL
jgi:hypothetical protein